MNGSVGILNVGAGDTKISFDPKNPAERIRAARIVKDMLRAGYALLVEVKPGEYQRAIDFDDAHCEYIIADMDGGLAQKDQGDAVTTDEAGTAKAAPERPRPRLKKLATKRIPAATARAVSVARTAGG